MNRQSSEPAPSNRPDRIRVFALATLTLVLVALCIALALPFLPAVTWAVALAIIAWPLHRWIGRHVKGPKLAALLSTVAVVVVILVPGMFVVYQVANEARAAAERSEGELTTNGLREKIVEIPVINRIVEWMEKVDLDVEAEVRKIIGSFTQDIAKLAQGSAAAIIQFLIVMFILYYLFVDRAEFLKGVRELLPLTRPESDRVFRSVADSVHANVFATVITSIIDATGGGLMFWALGLPAPFLWAVVMFVFSLLPVIGAGFVWVPAALFLLVSGRWLAALALVAWGVITFIIVDNIVYVRLAGKRMRMHEVPALIAFLGGLAVFGMSGMILGPAIVAVTIAFLDVWKQRLKQTQAEPATAE